MDMMIRSGITGFNDSATKPYLYPVYKKVYTEKPDTLPRCSLSIFWSKEFDAELKCEKNKEKPLH